MAVLTACGDDANVDDAADRTGDTAAEVGQDVRVRAEEAFSDLKARAQRFVDDLQTRNAPDAKQQVLDKCTETFKDLSNADSPEADRVEQLCDRIRDTDVSDHEAWTQIKDQLDEVQVG